MRTLYTENGKEYEFNCNVFAGAYFAKSSEFKEQNKTGESFFQYLQKEYGISGSSIKMWRRDRGPSNISVVHDLAEALDMDFKDLLIEKEIEDMDKKVNIIEKTEARTISDFTKEKIFNLYKLLVELIDEYFAVYEEGCYFDLLREMSYYDVAIPEDIYKSFEVFIDNVITPFFEDPSMLIKDLPEGRDIESARKRNQMLGEYGNQMMEKVEKFGEETVKPILLS